MLGHENSPCRVAFSQETNCNQICRCLPIANRSLWKRYSTLGNQPEGPSSNGHSNVVERQRDETVNKGGVLKGKKELVGSGKGEKERVTTEKRLTRTYFQRYRSLRKKGIRIIYYKIANCDSQRTCQEVKKKVKGRREG